LQHGRNPKQLVVVEIAAELFGEKDLALLRNHRLPFRNPFPDLIATKGQSPAIAFPAQETHLSAFEPSWPPPHINQRSALVKENSTFRH
jgi:hypothetical protein